MTLVECPSCGGDGHHACPCGGEPGCHLCICGARPCTSCRGACAVEEVLECPACRAYHGGEWLRAYGLELALRAYLSGEWLGAYGLKLALRAYHGGEWPGAYGLELALRAVLCPDCEERLDFPAIPGESATGAELEEPTAGADIPPAPVVGCLASALEAELVAERLDSWRHRGAGAKPCQGGCGESVIFRMEMTAGGFRPRQIDKRGRHHACWEE